MPIGQAPHADLFGKILGLFATVPIFFFFLQKFFQYSSESILVFVIGGTVVGVYILIFGILIIWLCSWDLKYSEKVLKYIKKSKRKGYKICFIGFSIICFIVELTIVIITIGILLFSYYLLFR